MLRNVGFLGLMSSLASFLARLPVVRSASGVILMFLLFHHSLMVSESDPKQEYFGALLHILTIVSNLFHVVWHNGSATIPVLSSKLPDVKGFGSKCRKK